MSRQQRRHKGKPHGISFADQLAQRRAYKEAMQQAAKDTVLDVKSQINTQRIMWLMCVAMNDAFGIGPERFVRFAECLQQRTDWYNEMVAGADDEYANEKLRQEAQRCSGIEIEYLYESEMLAAKKQHELDLIGNTEDHFREVTKMINGETL